MELETVLKDLEQLPGDAWTYTTIRHDDYFDYWYEQLKTTYQGAAVFFQRKYEQILVQTRIEGIGLSIVRDHNPVLTAFTPFPHLVKDEQKILAERLEAAFRTIEKQVPPANRTIVG